MINRRQFIQYVGIGGTSFLSGVSVYAHAASQPAVSPLSPLETFAFETVTLDRTGRVRFKQQKTALYFRESLGQTCALNMIAIPGAAFLPAFFMGQSPVTQTQWECVAKFPRIARDLHPNPACFQAPALPVESVSWLDAVEFCARLSSHTGRLYQLPSEAQWAYACRAGTTTPFHYGNTVTSELANYVGTYTYAAEQQGHYRRTTTPVGTFAPNAFGLYDMHGNVWEWSADRWLERSPQAFMRVGAAGEARDWRVLRGGSWSDPPVNIRAAARTGNAADALNRLFGFRICCVA